MDDLPGGSLRRWLASFRPAATSVSRTEQLRGAAGALVGILLTGLVSARVVGTGAALPALIAPMGASAVLLFAVPASPLAQPWSIIGGNLVASLVGVAAARLVPDPLLAAPLAAGVAVALMFALRCVHPPSGAVALTAVLGGPAISALGFSFVVAPVLLNSLIIASVALAFNNATRRRYPHAQVAGPAATRGGLSFTPADLDAVLARRDEVIDIARPDIEELFKAAEMEAFRRRFGDVTCAQVMAREPVSVEWGTPLAEAWALMRKRRLRALPVTDKGRRVLGLVEDIDFLRDLDVHSYRGLAPRFRRLMHPRDEDFLGTPEVVGQIMTRDVPTATAATNVVDLVPLLADAGRRHVPIVDDARKLIGTVAQSDLIAALYKTSLAGS